MEREEIKMNDYVCTICGYIYEEAKGIPEEGYAAGTIWGEIPESFACPLCGASKELFELVVKTQVPDNDIKEVVETSDEQGKTSELSSLAMSAVFTNLSKGCEKQYKVREQIIFEQLAGYFKKQDQSIVKSTMDELMKMMNENIDSDYKRVLDLAKSHGDRGAMRALAWNEKVTRMEKSLLTQYEQGSATMLKESKTYVCEICGFIYRGDDVPDVCPVCKVPKMKLTQVKGR